jgi:hypothetical protein
MLKCFVKGIDGRTVETVEFEIERTYPNSDGASIFDQQRNIPNYDPRCYYTISCGDIEYDIDRIGWAVLSEVAFRE